VRDEDEVLNVARVHGDHEELVLIERGEDYALFG
jgi:hypothetical protein